MKTTRIFLLVLFCHATSSFATNITLLDMEKLCAKSNWEEVNAFLISKGWEYYESENKILENNQPSKSITWSYGKSYDREQHDFLADGWFYLYTNSYKNEKPSALELRDTDSKVYNRVISELQQKKYKLQSSIIDNAYTKAVYESSLYTITITTSKTTREYHVGELWENVVDVSVWNYYIAKKGDIFDEYNGEKFSYYSSGQVKEHYILTKGKVNGQYTEYYADGHLAKVINFVDNQAIGKVIFYGPNGEIELKANCKPNGLSTIMLCDYCEQVLQSKLIGEMELLIEKDTSGYDFHIVYNGHYTQYFYENDSVKLTKEGNFSNGHGFVKIYDDRKLLIEETSYNTNKKDGIQRIYNYDQDGNLFAKMEGIFSDDIPINRHNYTYYLNDSLTYYLTTNYNSLGLKDGLEELKINEKKGSRVCSYTNYVDGVPVGDFQKIIGGDTLVFGTYDKEGKMHGQYKAYVDPLHKIFRGVYLISTDTTELLKVRTGYYQHGVRNGHWKFYDCSIFEIGNVMREEGDYVNGKKNGLWKYYYPNTRPIGSNDESQRVNSTSHGGELYLTRTYKDGYLHGLSTYYSLVDSTFADSTYEKVTIKIPYKLGKKDGVFEHFDENGKLYIVGHYSNDKRNGIWINYLTSARTVNSGVVECCFKDDEWSYSEYSIDDTLFVYGRKDNAHYTLKLTKNEHNISLETYRISMKGMQNLDSNIIDLPQEADVEILDGPAKYYDQEGRLIEEGEFRLNNRVNIWRYYYYSQKVRRDNDENAIMPNEKYWSLKSGKPFDGKVTFVNSNYRYVVMIKNGVRDGVTKIINSNTNKIAAKEIWKNGVLMEKYQSL